MGIMDAIGSLGGMGKMIELAKDPSKLAALGAQAMPGMVHTLGRMRLLVELSARAGGLTANMHFTLARAAIEKRDVSPEEMGFLDQQELAFLSVAKALNNYPKRAEDMTLEMLAQIHGLQTSNGKAGEGVGDQKDASPGAAGASPV